MNARPKVTSATVQQVPCPGASTDTQSEKSPAPSTLSAEDSSLPRPGVLRIGSVSFLNAKPLLYGLEHAANLRLGLDVPSRLLGDLQAGRFDVALLPSIDYQRMEGLIIVPAGGIACNGPTLTVRIFSKVPLAQIKRLACDTDSHTSVALARILLKELYNISPEFVDLNALVDMPGGLALDPLDERAVESASTAQLLIGDKVVTAEPVGYPYQLDLGEAWKKLTGLPFVFAVWMARPGVNLDGLMEQLTTARVAGLQHVEEIVDAHGVPRGWPRDIAIRYLTEYLKFEIGKPQLAAIELFHHKAAAMGILPRDARPLDILAGA